MRPFSRFVCLLALALPLGCAPKSIRGVTPDQGSSLVSNNAGSLTARIGGVMRAPSTLVSNNAGSYRTNSVAEVPVPDAPIQVLAPDGAPIPGATASTDAEGRFFVPTLEGRPVIVVGQVPGTPAHFQMIALPPETGIGTADLSAGTTLATAALLKVSRAKQVDPTPLVARVQALALSLSDLLPDSGVAHFSESPASLVSFVTDLLQQAQPLSGAFVNGYTGLCMVGDRLALADNTRNRLVLSDQGVFSSWWGGEGPFADGPLASARLGAVYGMTRREDGTVYLADAGSQRIRAVSSDGLVETLAGGEAGFRDGEGTSARFQAPTSVALGPDGALYVADTDNGRIRRIDLGSKTVTTVAGGGSQYGDRPGLELQLGSPRGLVADEAGNLYFAESDLSEIRQMRLSNGVWSVRTIAGNFLGQPFYSLVDGPGSQARFFLPMALAYHSNALYVADTFDHAIRRIDLAADGFPVTSVVGGGPHGMGDLDGPVTQARLRGPDSLAIAPDGTIWVGDGGNLKLKKIAGGAVETVHVP